MGHECQKPSENVVIIDRNQHLEIDANSYLIETPEEYLLPKEKLESLKYSTEVKKLPSWGEHLFKTRNVWLVEETIVDPKTKTMSVYTRNLNLRVFMGTTEKQTIVPDSDTKTKVFKECWIESDIYGLRSAIKKFGVDRFKKNCDRATKGFEWVLRGQKFE